MGKVDHIVELRPFSDDITDKRRIISCKGRLGISERVVEWRGGNRFAYIGNTEGARANQVFESVAEVLKAASRPLSVNDFIALWPTDSPPAKPTLQRWLRTMIASGDLAVAQEAIQGKNGRAALYDFPQQNAEFDPFAFDDDPEQWELFEFE